MYRLILTLSAAWSKVANPSEPKPTLKRGEANPSTNGSRGDRLILPPRDKATGAGSPQLEFEPHRVKRLTTRDLSDVQRWDVRFRTIPAWGRRGLGNLRSTRRPSPCPVLTEEGLEERAAARPSKRRGEATKGATIPIPTRAAAPPGERPMQKRP